MRVLVAGSTGVIGRQLVPQLVQSGHHVIALVRHSTDRTSPPRRGSSVTEVRGDLLDRDRLIGTVKATKPDAVVHMATAIPRTINPRRLADDFHLTNRLRTEGIRNLIDAAEKVKVSRIVAQGLAYMYDPSIEGLATEESPTWRNPPAQFAPVLEALRYQERMTALAGGLVLRLGHLYGPGTIYGPGGSFLDQVRAGKVPLVGEGASVFSFVHTQDVARAILAALWSDTTGIVNVVDDDPAPISEWLPALAEMIGAPAPRRIPYPLARLLVGGWGAAFMARLTGASNDAAFRRLGWEPQFSSWREGFEFELGNWPQAAA